MAKRLTDHNGETGKLGSCCLDFIHASISTKSCKNLSAKIGQVFVLNAIQLLNNRLNPRKKLMLINIVNLVKLPTRNTYLLSNFISDSSLIFFSFFFYRCGKFATTEKGGGRDEVAEKLAPFWWASFPLQFCSIEQNLVMSPSF